MEPVAVTIDKFELWCSEVAFIKMNYVHIYKLDYAGSEDYNSALAKAKSFQNLIPKGYRAVVEDIVSKYQRLGYVILDEFEEDL
jgi:hypothetical protein